ncbi:MAG: stage II sporulation protein M [Deltaproteobacteria bacterium]|nr:stage II sporulation protein M [Deltaproteobacteria bacterium]
MIIDLSKFIDEERVFWAELDKILEKISGDPAYRMSLEEMKRFYYLYQRTSADLAKIITFSAEPEIHRYLESLVGRAYCEIHETRSSRPVRSPFKWFTRTLPRTFRKNIKAFALSLFITMGGMAFGGGAVVLDPDAKEILMPFPHLQIDPSERVAKEESVSEDHLEGVKTTGAAAYMTHNTRVSLFTISLGVTWGIGTVIMLFYNGVILGAVALDYVRAGQASFLLAWLSPHGVIEIPAILIAGQAGLVLAGAFIGWGRRNTLSMRLREISGDLVTLSACVGLMMVWAGFIEAFISQYHEPVLPYSIKIGFALVELILLVLFLCLAGTGVTKSKKISPEDMRGKDIG